ncbi:MAG: lytic transglycosylase domain-containing protein [Clostridiales bacterium]|nr:lytic transglycosylase domain-containing protein [Clostridiales bacterium]
MLKLKNNKIILALPFAAAIFFLAATMFLRAFPLRYPSLIYEYSEKYSLDPAVVCAVINTESRFNENAASSKGAKGLMQLMEATAEWAASETDKEDYSSELITNPDINIELGCWLLSTLIDKYNGNLDTALCAYNAGSGNVDSWLTSGETALKAIPYYETKAYLTRVKRRTLAYRLILGIIGGKYES